MYRFLILILILISGFREQVRSQHYGAWKLVYGDTSAQSGQLPELINILPIKGNFRLQWVERLFLQGTRMHHDSYDPCTWTSPWTVNVVLHTAWDIVGIYPEVRYAFDQSGRFLRYFYFGQKSGNPDELVTRRKEIHQYNEDGRLALVELVNYTVPPDEYITNSAKYHYDPDGRLMAESKRRIGQPSTGTDTYDSIHYSYHPFGEIAETVRYSGALGVLPGLSGRSDYEYDSIHRLSRSTVEDWIPDRQAWAVKELVEYIYDSAGRLKMKTTTTVSPDGPPACRRLSFAWSPDGLETVQTGSTLLDTLWVEDYYFREVRNERGQPVILDEFHKDAQGRLYINLFGNFHGFGRTNGDLRGKNRFTYDEDGLIKTFMNYSRMDQADDLPDIKMVFTWKDWSSAVDNLTSAPAIKIYPNPCSDRICIDFEQVTGSPIAVEILDPAGRVWISFDRTPGKDRIEIGLTGLSAGIYFARIRMADWVHQVKFVKR